MNGQEQYASRDNYLESAIGISSRAVNEYFDDEYELLQDQNFWSQSDKPYQYIDVTNMLND